MSHAQRIDKENAQAEKFWAEQAMKNTSAGAAQQRQYAGSVAPSQARSAAPTGYSSKSSVSGTKHEIPVWSLRDYSGRTHFITLISNDMHGTSRGVHANSVSGTKKERTEAFEIIMTGHISVPHYLISNDNAWDFMQPQW